MSPVGHGPWDPKTSISLKENQGFLYTGNSAATRRQRPRERQLDPSGRPTQQEPFARALGKNHVEKTLLREFCRYFRAEISHGDPDREKNNFQKRKKKTTLPKDNIFSKSRPHNGPQPNPQRRKWPQMDSLVMNFSSKSVICVVFYNISCHFSRKPTFSFYPI